MAKASTGTLYRGGEGMWSWVAHRVTGVGIFFFLLVHVLDTALVRVSPGAYNAVIDTYKTPLLAFGEVVLVAAIAFHAFNGLRVVAVDFLKNGARHHRTYFWVAMGLWLVVMVGFLWRHIPNSLEGIL